MASLRHRQPAKETKKRKKKDFNKKADEKEGSDMDAFLGEEKPLNQNNKTISAPPPDEKNENEIEIEELKKEEQKVAEKNEENSRVSLAVEALEQETPKEIKNSEPSDTESPSMQLKYLYEEDQWSPLNPAGKKKYGRDFLLKMQYESVCMKKPDLPTVEIVRELPNLQKVSDPSRFQMINIQGRDNDPFMPNFVRSSNPMRPSQGGVKGGRQRGQQSNEKKKIIIASSVPMTVELRTTENAWKPLSRLQDAIKDSDEVVDAKIYREVRSILNKLTPEKFASLIKQLGQLQIDTVERLEGVISLVFEKAVDEPKFAVPYANMCKHLALIKVKVDGSENQTINFRKLLLTKCQREFEKDYRDDETLAKIQQDSENSELDEKKQQKKDEYADLVRKARRRSLGNIRFIGELYKLGMLTAPIMHDCLKKLLMLKDEDSLECFCHLIHTIGHNLTSETKSKPNLSKHNMDDYFKQVKNIVEKGDVSSRIKFLLLDTIEFKENNYVSTRISTPAQNNPTTIASIHQEAQREALKAQQEVHLPNKRSDDRDRKKSRGGSNYQQANPSEDGWSVSGSRGKKEYISLDPNKKLSKLDTESLQFGPHGRTGGASMLWARGSSGGTKQTESEAKSTFCTNKFSALASNETPAQGQEHRRGGQRSAASSRESSRNGGGRQMAPPGVRKSLSQTSAATHEKEDAVNAVKHFVKNTQSQKLEHPEGRPAKKEDHHILQGKDMSEEDLETKVTTTLEAYLLNEDIADACLSVAEIVSPNTIHHFLMYTLQVVLDRSARSRQLMGQFILGLFERKMITMDIYEKVLVELLSCAEDYSIDIPRFYEYLAELILPVFMGKDICAGFLRDVCKDYVSTPVAPNLVAAFLEVALRTESPQVIQDKWRTAQLELSDFLSPGSDVQEFIAKNKLEAMFSLPSGEDLSHVLKTAGADNTPVIEWINANVVEEETRQPTFIRALTTAIMESGIAGSGANCTVNTEVLKSRCAILNKYINHQESLELEVLYAVQILMNRLEHPQDLIKILFELLYDVDVITEDCFDSWKKAEEPAEMEGRAMALVSSSRFFQCLFNQEATED